MLQPKKTKFRKMQKGRNRGMIHDMKINFGSFGLKAIDRGRITSRQIESAQLLWLLKYVKMIKL